MSELFDELMAEWYDATAHLSNMRTVRQHPVFEQIISGIRNDADMKYFFLKLEEGKWELHAMLILSEYTGERPTKGVRGNVALMKKSWLDWANEEGIM
tara:strand:+ start:4875 stop:5168 length:294 start_codon:yes stop_codon:yes gene_type:complete